MECWLPFKDLSSSTCFLEERKEILKSITYRNVDYSLIFFIPYMNCPETFKSNRYYSYSSLFDRMWVHGLYPSGLLSIGKDQWCRVVRGKVALGPQAAPVGGA